MLINSNEMQLYLFETDVCINILFDPTEGDVDLLLDPYVLLKGTGHFCW